MKKTVFLVLFFSLLFSAQSSEPVFRFFKGGASQNFSDVANWDIFPKKGEGINISAKAGAPHNPVIIDKEFKIDLWKVCIFSGGNQGVGTAYVALTEGAILNCLVLSVGNLNNGAFKGKLFLRKGSIVKPTHLNSGAVEIGGDGAETGGELIVEPEVALFSHASLVIHKTGRLAFIFGPDGVTPFTPTLVSRDFSHKLNGLIQVDLKALTRPGGYPLISGVKSKVTLAGEIIDWLRKQSGRLSGLGSFTSPHFAVVNGGTWAWTLTMNDKDLTLTVDKPK